MRKISILLAAVLILLLLSTGVALAQSDQTDEVVYCGNLDEADCARLNASQDAMVDLTSGETVKSTELVITGLGSADQAGLRVERAQVFVADEAAIDRILDLRAMDPEEIAGDPEVLAEVMLLHLTIDSSRATTIELSPELAESLSGLLGINVPDGLSFETRLIDGILYVNLTQLAELIPQLGGLGEWIGIDLAAFVPEIVAKSAESGEIDVEDIPDMLQTPGESIMAQPYLVMVEPDQEDLFNHSLELIPLRDDAVDGSSVAVYLMRLDVPRYLASPAFAQRLQQSESEDETLDLAQYSNLIQAGATLVFADTVVQAVQGIGYDDAYLYNQEMDLAWSIGDFGVALNVEAANRNMNNVLAIPVPTDAFVPPIRLIMGLIETFTK